MSTTRLHRFDFGSLRDFRGPLVAAVMPEEPLPVEPPPPPPPTFSEEELIAARAAGEQFGYSKGFEAGLARATEQADAQQLAVETTILQMGHLLHSLQQGYQQLLDAESTQLTALVTLIARKVAGDALQAHHGATIQTLVTQCLPVILSKPRLIIELHPDAFEQTLDQIESLLQANGFEGETQFRSNPALGVYDALLDWGSGQAQRNTAQLWQDIETLLASMPITPPPVQVSYQLPPTPQSVPVDFESTHEQPNTNEPLIPPTV